MEKRQRLFIYDRREMGVLLLLCVMVALFAFTLGIHLGKHVGVADRLPHPVAAAPAPTEPDAAANRQDLTEQAPGVPQAADETLDRQLHEEVARTGIRLETPRAVELPEKTVSENGGETTTAPPAPNARKSPPVAPMPRVVEPVKPPTAEERETPSGKFSLQVGSHPTATEAKHQVDSLEALGLRPFLRAVDIKGKGHWFRVYIGGYETRDEAEKAGARFREQKMIESFIVANLAK